MAVARVIYFSGTTELHGADCIDNAEFAARFPGITGKRYDSFRRWVGYPLGAVAARFVGCLPVTRIIDYQRNASKHRCDARCRHAKGRNCECSCGGQFHGAGD